MRRKAGAARMLVSVSEAKEHLHLDGNDEDMYLQGLLLAAQEAASSFCLTEFPDTLPQTVRLAILLHTGHFYAYREGGDAAALAGMLDAFHSLLWPHRNAAGLF